MQLWEVRYSKSTPCSRASRYLWKVRSKVFSTHSVKQGPIIYRKQDISNPPRVGFHYLWKGRSKVFSTHSVKQGPIIYRKQDISNPPRVGFHYLWKGRSKVFSTHSVKQGPIIYRKQDISNPPHEARLPLSMKRKEQGVQHSLREAGPHYLQEARHFEPTPWGTASTIYEKEGARCSALTPWSRAPLSTGSKTFRTHPMRHGFHYLWKGRSKVFSTHSVKQGPIIYRKQDISNPPHEARLPLSMKRKEQGVQHSLREAGPHYLQEARHFKPTPWGTASTIYEKEGARCSARTPWSRAPLSTGSKTFRTHPMRHGFHYLWKGRSKVFSTHSVKQGPIIYRKQDISNPPRVGFHYLWKGRSKVFSTHSVKQGPIIYRKQDISNPPHEARLPLSMKRKEQGVQHSLREAGPHYLQEARHFEPTPCRLPLSMKRKEQGVQHSLREAGPHYLQEARHFEPTPWGRAWLGVGSKAFRIDPVK